MHVGHLHQPYPQRSREGGLCDFEPKRPQLPRVCKLSLHQHQKYNPSRHNRREGEGDEIIDAPICRVPNGNHGAHAQHDKCRSREDGLEDPCLAEKYSPNVGRHGCGGHCVCVQIELLMRMKKR